MRTPQPSQVWTASAAAFLSLLPRPPAPPGQLTRGQSRHNSFGLTPAKPHKRSVAQSEHAQASPEEARRVTKEKKVN